MHIREEKAMGPVLVHGSYLPGACPDGRPLSPEESTVNATSPTPPHAAAPSTDPADVIARAALTLCVYSEKPSLTEEISDRLGMVKDAIEHLETVTCNADFHGFELLPRSLYGLIRLIGREVRMIDELYKAI